MLAVVHAMVLGKGQAFLAGLAAEKKVRLFFEAQGYACLAHRFKTPYGEIDLVMAHADSLVFVEVKQRATWEDALWSLGERQKKRWWQAAQVFLASATGSWATVQFDFVGVNNAGELYHVPHVLQGGFTG